MLGLAFAYALEYFNSSFYFFLAAMSPEILTVLVIVAVGAILFITDLFPPDVTALGLMLTLLLTGILDAEEAFRGFGSDTVILFFGLLIGTAALIRTGMVDSIGGLLAKHFSTRPRLLLLLIMLSVAILSAFISNTATAALFLPIVLGVTKKANLPPSRYLLPMAFCSIVVSSVTLISTSTNIVVSGLMTTYGLKTMGMFELAPVGIPIAIVGLLYMWYVAPKLLPNRGADASAEEDFGLRPYLSDLLVLPESPLIGKTLDQSGLWHGSEVNVLRVVRNNTFILPRSHTRLEQDDILLVEAERESLLKIKDKAGVDIKADAKLSDPDVDPAELRIVEALVGANSPLIQRTLKSMRFRAQYEVQVLALTRSGEQIRAKLSEIRIKQGDILLLQGLAEDLKTLGDSGVVQILGAVRSNRLSPRKAWLVVSFFIAAIMATAWGFLSAPVAFLLSATAMFLTGCLEPRDAYRTIDWALIVMVGAILSVGLAMDKTGTAQYLASIVTEQSESLDPRALLGAFFILTLILTQIMSNQAAAVVVLPVAIQTAIASGYDPRSFAMMVAIAASCSFLTPLEPACLMVYGPGGYRFGDFPRVGLLLTILILTIAVVLVPIVWPVR